MAKDTASESDLRESRSKKGIVRPEAQPLKWDELTRDQREIIERVHDWLIEFAEEPLEEPRSARSRNPFDYQKPFEHHRSNVLLLDGGRGSGKTSILVTLFDLWRQKAAGERLAEFPRTASALGSGKLEDPKLHASIISALNGPLAGRLVPVRPLDLQPLPHSTSLLSWVAGRILELVNHVEGLSGSPGERPHTEPIASWQPDWRKELGSRLAWRKFMKCAALGWNSNLPERQGNLDPDSYAEELKDAEWARLGMVDAWREFVAAVINDLHQLYPKLVQADARLIIPIDDADMNPHRCVELLELTRALWSSQVVFVLTGHSKLFRKMLYIHYLGTLRKRLGSSPLQQQELAYLEAAPSTRTLALQIYDKIIPPSHRFAFPALHPNERLLRLQDAMSVELVKDRSEKNLPPRMLSGYFTQAPLLQRGLPHRLRRVIDMQLKLRGRERAGEVVRHLWVDAIDNGEWSLQEQRRLKDLVQLAPGEAVRLMTHERLTVNSEPVVQFAERAGIRVDLHVITDHTFTARLFDEPMLLPEHLSCLLMLACNVAADETDGGLPEPVPVPRNIDYPLVVSHMGLPLSPSASLRFYWPLPQWVAPNDFLILDDAWRERISVLRSEGTPVDKWFPELVGFFLSAALGVGTRRQVPTAIGAKPKNWQATLPEIVTTAQKRNIARRTLREVNFHKWLLGEVWLLAAPEYGLEAELANEILEKWWQAVKKFSGLAEEMTSMARKARRERAQFALLAATAKEDVEKFLLDVDTAHSEHQWAYRMEGRQRPMLEPTPGIQQQLGQIRVQHAPDSSAQAPRSLREYITRLDAMALLSTRHQPRLEDLERQLGKYVTAQGAAPLALQALWRYVIDEEPRSIQKQFRQAFSSDGLTMKVHLPERLEERLSRPLTARGDSEAEYRFGRWRGLRIYQTKDWLDAPSHAIQALLKVAHDVDADEHDTGRKDSPHERRGSEGALPAVATLVFDQLGVLEVDWPVPHWNTFLDWNLTEKVWSTIYRGLVPILKDEEGLMRSVIVNIAHSLLRGMTSVWSERSVPDQYVDLRLSEKELASDVGTLLSIPGIPSRKGIRHKRFVEWVEGPVVLFGAPETGLPGTVVEEFLRLLLKEVPLRPGQESAESERRRKAYIERARTLRRERIQRALQRAKLPSDDGTVRQVIARIDGIKTSHPWVRLFGSEVEGLAQPTRRRTRTS